MTEHPTLSIETAFDDESVEIKLREGGRIEIVITVYDPKTDSFVSKIADIGNPIDVRDMGLRLFHHAKLSAHERELELAQKLATQAETPEKPL